MADADFTITLALDDEGKQLLQTLKDLKAGGRLVTPDLVSQLVRERDELKLKHDTLKELLESYKQQWKDHYERELAKAVAELQALGQRQREEYLDHKADDRVEGALRAVLEFIEEQRLKDDCRANRDVRDHVELLIKEKKL